MTRKTYLIRFYNVAQKLLALLILSGVVLFLLNVSHKLWLNTMILTSGLSLLEQAIKVLQVFMISLSALLVVLLLIEVMTRIKRDTLVNLGKSLLGTFRFRLFLKQSQHLPNNAELSEQRQTENKVLTNFNRAVGKSVLDISNQQLTLFIKVPRQVQAQKILKVHEEQIKEHISSLYPEYLISTFERRKFNLWLIGTKRK